MADDAPAAAVPPGLMGAGAPRPTPALERLVALEMLAQQELAGAARLQEATAPGQDDLVSILVAWDLAL